MPISFTAEKHSKQILIKLKQPFFNLLMSNSLEQKCTGKTNEKNHRLAVVQNNLLTLLLQSHSAIFLSQKFTDVTSKAWPTGVGYCSS